MPRAGLSAEILTRSAAVLADEEGLAGVTLAAVARRFDVKAPSLYAHVSGNRDLKQRVAVLALAETADRVAEAVAGLSGRDALAALGRAYRDYAADHPGRHQATSLPLDDDAAHASAAPRHAALARAVLRSYALPEPDETHAVRPPGRHGPGLAPTSSWPAGSPAASRTPTSPAARHRCTRRPVVHRLGRIGTGPPLGTGAPGPRVEPCTNTSDSTTRQRPGTTTPATRSGSWLWPTPSRRRWTSAPR